jgi:hypothetical protein
MAPWRCGPSELVHVHRRGVDDLVRHAPNRLELGALVTHALERRSMARQRMRPAGLAVTPDQRRLAGLEEDQRRTQSGQRAERFEDARKLLEERALAHVDDDGGLLDLRVGPQRQLREDRQQRDREIVDAEVAEVLERAHRLGLAGAREAGEDDEPRRRVAGPRAVILATGRAR